MVMKRSQAGPTSHEHRFHLVNLVLQPEIRQALYQSWQTVVVESLFKRAGKTPMAIRRPQLTSARPAD